MLNLYQLTLPLTALTSFALGLFVLIKNPRSHINITWFLMSCCVAGWSLAGRFYMFASDEKLALEWCRISQSFVGWISLFFAHFCLALANRSAKKNVHMRVGYILNVALTLWILNSNSTMTVSPKLVFSYFVDSSPSFAAETILFFYFTLYAHLVLYQGLKAVANEKKNQVKYTLLASILGFLSGSTFFLPAYGVQHNPIAGNFIWVYGVVISYAILKHHLMDITVVFRKSVVYSLLVALITVTYLLFVLVTERLLQGVMRYRALAPSLLAAFLIAIGFIPLKNWIQSFVDRYFFKGTQTTIAAENERLRHEVERTEKLKAISLFASGMAHEIKNPLATLKTFAAYLPQKYDDAEFRAKCARIIGQEVERIHTIVQQLLTFAKPAPPKLQSVRAAQVLDETLDFLQAELVRKHLRLTRSYATPDTITADPAQLKQVFLNLLLNAIEATPTGGTITATTIPNGRYLTITIADTGRGVAPELLARLGEPFVTTKPNGTGLGLAVVHGILEQHHGSLQMVSRSGQGTQAQIQLPLARTLGKDVLKYTSY